MSLAAGARLGPYEIVALLGSGGMGEVYRAKDTRLGRFVAVKTLKPELAAWPEARERFEREARAISKLAHPHVCAIYDVGEADGVAFLVMQLLDGNTLAARLAHGPLPLGDLLSAATDIADALAAAHRQGIVHRDLKPGNVMLTASGVKLVDFGLAKALAPVVAAGAGDLANVTAATALPALTEEGTILGTAPYMSPEQIQGKPADPRSDIFSLGSVLYEMATGRRAFPGQTMTEVAAAILHREPAAPSTLRADLPRAFDRLVRDCLVKKADSRWQSAHDVALQLAAIDESVKHDADGPAGADAAGKSRGTAAGKSTATFLESTPLVAWALAFVAIVAAGVLWWQRTATESFAAGRRIELQVMPPPGGSFLLSFEAVSFAVSPDGSQLAYVATDPGAPRRLWLRPRSSVEATPIAGTDGAGSVFWAPDGKSIGFFADGALKRLELTSGVAATVCSVPRGIGMTGTWNTDGQILFATVEGATIFKVPAAGGAPVAEMAPDPAKNEVRTSFPSFLPDGRHFLYLTRNTDNTGRLMLGELGQPPRQIMAAQSNAHFVPHVPGGGAGPGTLVFERGGALVGQRFDPETAALSGDVFAITKTVRFMLAIGSAIFHTSANGTIVYQASRDVAGLKWFDRSGQASPAIDAPGTYLEMRLAASGTTVVASRVLPSTGAYDIWQYDLARGTQTRLTPDDNVTEVTPLLLPDEQTLIYSSAQGGPPRLFKRNLATGSEERMLPAARGLQGVDDMSPDGTLLAYEERTERGNYNFWTLPLAGGTPTSLRASSSNDVGLRYSPDGRFYSFSSNESGRMEIYIAPVAGGPKVAVSNGGAGLARWSRDGRELYYLTGDKRLMVVTVQTSRALNLGRPTTLFAIGGRPWIDYDVSPDGQRFLAIVTEITGNEQPLTAVANWAR